MLVLTRKHQQQIRIGGNITITVLRVKGNTVRLGIEAPRNIRVVRGELPLNDSSNSQEQPVHVGVCSEAADSEFGRDEHAEAEGENNTGKPVTELNRLQEIVRRVTNVSASATHAI